MHARCASLMMIATMVAHAFLSGCSTNPWARHQQHHAAQQSKQDLNARCQVRRDMMRARTEQERRAKQERPSGMMQEHGDMQHEECK